jgi:hypothetical protein
MDPTPGDGGMLPAAKLPRREGMKAVEKLYNRSAIAVGSRPMTTASGGDAVRRHQSHLDEGLPVPPEAASSASALATPAVALASTMEWRGGPQKLSELKLRVLAKTDHFLVINKCEDHRLDGDFDATIEKAVRPLYCCHVSPAAPSNLSIHYPLVCSCIVIFLKSKSFDGSTS